MSPKSRTIAILAGLAIPGAACNPVPKAAQAPPVAWGVPPAVAQPTVAQPTVAQPTVAQPNVARPSLPAPAALPLAAPAAPMPAAPMPAAPAAPVAGPPLQVRAVRSFAWGAGADQLGRVLQGEQNPEAPMSVDADADGVVAILDQVNSRVVLLSPAGVLHSVSVSRTAQDLLLTQTGLWTLDRLVDASAVWTDRTEGKTLAKVVLADPDPDFSPGMTGLFARDGALWAEREHAQLVRLAGLDGKPVPRTGLWGRPGADGKWLLRAQKVPPDSVAVAAQAPGAAEDAAPAWTLQAQFSQPVWQLLELAGDAAGRTWVVAETCTWGPDDQPLQAKREVQVWSGDRSHADKLDLCAASGPEETLRPVRLGADGKLRSLCVQPGGVTLQEVAP